MVARRSEAVVARVSVGGYGSSAAVGPGRSLRVGEARHSRSSVVVAELGCRLPAAAGHSAATETVVGCSRMLASSRDRSHCILGSDILDLEVVD